MRNKPGGYSNGSPGVGTAHHLLTELILSREQLTAVHVPYLGSVKAVVDLAEGRFDFMFLDATVALPQIAAGKIKDPSALGVAAPDAGTILRLPARLPTERRAATKLWAAFVLSGIGQ